jgi:hypothetical protein
MSARVFAFLLLATLAVSAQEVTIGRARAKKAEVAEPTIVRGAWLDLRQNTAGKAGPQSAPAWVQDVSMVPQDTKDGAPPKTTFRVKLAPPAGDFPLLMFRLFFEDRADRRPRLLAADQSGGLLLQTTPLGVGLGLATSESVMVPADGVATVDVEVPGDGRTIRGAYLNWMRSSEVVRPIDAEQRYLMPETFGGDSPLRAPNFDVENLGTVTATLAPETIAIGQTLERGAAFQFPLEEQPLVALLTFEVSSAYTDSPPEVFVNGQSIGPVSMAFPELADPAYRGEMKALVREMRFQYTGWLRAQKLVPASYLHAGANDLLVVSGPGTEAAAIRTTQIQLKYPWEKLDYQLIPGR